MSTTVVAVPSYCGSNMKGYDILLKKFIPNLIHLSNVDNLVFKYNLQDYPDFTHNSVAGALDSTLIYNPTWRVFYQFRDKYDPVSMYQIRYDTMHIYDGFHPEPDYYLWTDDDVVYHEGSGDCYNEIIRFFDKNPMLGFVMSAGYLGGYRYNHKLKYAVSKHWQLSRGIFFRNIPNLLDPNIVGTHIGGYEDMLIAMEVLYRGYHTATHFNNPAYHKAAIMEKRSDTQRSNGKTPRYEDDQIHKVAESLDSIEKYIKNRFGVDYPLMSMNDFKTVLNMIYDNYLQSGGDDWYSVLK